MEWQKTEPMRFAVFEKMWTQKNSAQSPFCETYLNIIGMSSNNVKMSL